MNMRCGDRSTNIIAATLKKSKKVIWLFINASEKYDGATKHGWATKLFSTDRRVMLRETK